MERGGVRRGLRPATVALASLGAAMVAHRLSGAALPALPLLVLLALPLVGAAAAAGRLSFPLRAALAGAGQVALHQLFMLLAGGGPVAALPAHGGHAHGVWAAGPEPMAGGHSSLSATFLHALATAAVVLLLARGERLLAGLLRAVRPRPLARPALPARARAVVVAPVRPARGALLALLPPRRGPPALLGP